MSERQEQPNENDVDLCTLPEEWNWADLGDVCLVRLGKTPRKKDYRSTGNFKILKFRDLKQSGDIDWEKDDKGFVDSSNEVPRTLKEVEQGDVLVTASAHMSDHIGKKIGYVSYIPKKYKAAYFVGEILQARASEGIEPKWLLYYLQSSDGYKAIQKRVHGVHLIASRAKNIEIPIAPLEQQKRIVAEIEKQFSRLDEAVANLKRVKANLKRYKAAVLKAAVEGKLTEEWRKQHPDVEPASKLLERILTERRQKWEEAELAKMKDKGKVPKDDKWKKKYKEPEKPMTDGLQAPPIGWEFASLEEITSGERVICYGILMPKEHVPDGVPYVKVKDMKGDVVDLEGLSRTKPEIAAKYERASLKTGDLLLSIRGTYGRVADVPPELDGGNITQDTVRVDVSPHIEKEYVALHLRTPDSQQYFKRVARGVAVKGVNVADVRLTPLYIPPQKEQAVVVSQIKSSMSIVDEIEVEIETNLKRANSLRQSILGQAFLGNLF